MQNERPCTGLISAASSAGSEISDPTVRVAATELRKWLTLYYIEPSHEDEPRIEVSVRSYFAEFRLPEQKLVPPPLQVLPPASIPSPVDLQPTPRRSKFRYWYFAAPLAAIILALAGKCVVR